jgi:arsenate reductase (glutaredoxin)
MGVTGKHDQACDDLWHQSLRHDEEGARLEGWVGQVGWESLLNRSGTTFRKLPDSDKQGLSAAKAVALMIAQPSMIKRPVLDIGGTLVVGFKPELYAASFAR